jgi:hypothetical protein
MDAITREKCEGHLHEIIVDSLRGKLPPEFLSTRELDELAKSTARKIMDDNELYVAAHVIVSENIKKSAIAPSVIVPSHNITKSPPVSENILNLWNSVDPAIRTKIGKELRPRLRPFF